MLLSVADHSAPFHWQCARGCDDEAPAGGTTSAEYEEVRQTLGTAWEALQVMKPSQLERWLDVSIGVYEKGWTFRYDAAHEWQEDYPSASVGPEQLWFPDPAGHWFCMRHNCPRGYGDHERFTPFFDMLERHTQPHT